MSSLVLRNARVVGGPKNPVDVAITDGVIATIGAADAAGQSLDLDGRYLSPGLWDNHVHFTQWSLVRTRLDVAESESAAHAARLVAAELAVRSAEPTLLVGYGFRDGLWPDAPNLGDLDAASGRIPVVLVSADVHAVWLNSAALALFGRRSETGLLREEDAFDIQRQLDTAEVDVLDRAADAAARAAAARGVVGIVDLEMGWNAETWARRMAAGTNSLRVEIGVYAQYLERAIDLGMQTGQRLGELLTMGRFKVITDGSLNTRTAYCDDEYPGLEGQSGSHGLITVPYDRLVPLMSQAAAAGIRSSVHAIGDRANRLAIDAFEQLGHFASGGTIEHAQLLALDDLPRFAALGIVASVQPEHAMDDRDVADRYWAGRTDRAFLLRSLLDAGVTLALGSDAPVAPLDPWVTMAAAVTRTRDGREPWHPEQSISMAEALAASTRTTVAVGQPADLVVTESDPLTSDLRTDGLREMKVAATLVGGRLTHLSDAAFD
ncbi:amidohydrolase family protein [soil metagenome]